VLLTGGAGFIGSHTAEHLLSRGDCVAIVDELNTYYDVRIKRANVASLMEAFGRGRVKLFVGDIADEAFIREVFMQVKPKRVVHLAARAGVRPSLDDPFIYVHSNVHGTTRMLEQARDFKVQSFVYASSSSVYGGSKSTFFSESERVDKPISPYAATKAACELMAHVYHHLYRMNVTGLRFFTVYGPRGRPDMAPFVFMDRIVHGRSIQRYGDGSTSRDYTYVGDIVDGVVRALDRPNGFRVYNLGRGSPVLLNDFISEVESATGKEASIETLPMQPGDVPRTCANITLAQTELGYTPSTPLSEGIHAMANWYRMDYVGTDERGNPRDIWGLSDAEQEEVISSVAEIYHYRSKPLSSGGPGILLEDPNWKNTGLGLQSILVLVIIVVVLVLGKIRTSSRSSPSSRPHSMPISLL
jgi:UDP-glucuronate 4-epimerase